MPNRRKHTNSIPVASLTRWIVAAFFLTVAGLSYVYFKNQLHATGNEIKALERQIGELDTQREIINGKISQLSSRAALQRRLKDNDLRMIPISHDRVVRVSSGSANAGDLRHVSNEGATK